MAKMSKYSRAALTELTRNPLPKNLCERHDGNLLDRIYTKLGLTPGGHVPKDFKGKFNVDGHSVVVFPSRATSIPGRWGSQRIFKPKTVSGRKYSLSRMFFQLKGSGKLVPVGRVRQVAECKGGGTLSGLGGTRKCKYGRLARPVGKRVCKQKPRKAKKPIRSTRPRRFSVYYSYEPEGYPANHRADTWTEARNFAESVSLTYGVASSVKDHNTGRTILSCNKGRCGTRKR